jgi:hypothetical protein
MRALVYDSHRVESQRMRTALDLFELSLDLMRQNLRRRHPEAGEPTIERLLQDWLLRVEPHG